MEEEKKVIQIELTKRTLDQLIDMLPVDVPYQNTTMSFGLEKKINHNSQEIYYECYAFFTGEFDHWKTTRPTWDEDSMSRMKFTSTDPCIAVSMMIGHLKYNKLIS